MPAVDGAGFAGLSGVGMSSSGAYHTLCPAVDYRTLSGTVACTAHHSRRHTRPIDEAETDAGTLVNCWKSRLFLVATGSGVRQPRQQSECRQADCADDVSRQTRCRRRRQQRPGRRAAPRNWRRGPRTPGAGPRKGFPTRIAARYPRRRSNTVTAVIVRRPNSARYAAARAFTIGLPTAQFGQRIGIEDDRLERHRLSAPSPGAFGSALGDLKPGRRPGSPMPTRGYRRGPERCRRPRRSGDAAARSPVLRSFAHIGPRPRPI